MADVYSDPAWDRAIAERDAEIARLKEEVARMRTALTDIATVRGLAADLQARARAALTEPRA